MSSLLKRFKMDEKAEQEGVWLDYGDVRVRVARAGGSNNAYSKALEEKLRPYRPQIRTDTMSLDDTKKVTAEVVAETIVRDVQVKVGGKWKSGISPEDIGLEGDKLWPASNSNIVKLITGLPDLLRDIEKTAANADLYLQAYQDQVAGN